MSRKPTTEEPRQADLEATLDRLQAAAARHAATHPEPEPVVPDPKAEELRRAQEWARFVPSRFASAGLRDFKDRRGVHGPLVSWLDDGYPSGRNLVLFGATGVGKTHAALAAARNVYVRHAVVAEFVPVVELYDRLRPGGSESALVDACRVPLLILDDLGAEKVTDWTAERLYLIVNRRWLDVLPTIATSNLPPEELADAIGGRTYSRLVDHAETVALGGEDRRRT